MDLCFLSWMFVTMWYENKCAPKHRDIAWLFISVLQWQHYFLLLTSHFLDELRSKAWSPGGHYCDYYHGLIFTSQVTTIHLKSEHSYIPSAFCLFVRTVCLNISYVMHFTSAWPHRNTFRSIGPSKGQVPLSFDVSQVFFSLNKMLNEQLSCL